MVNNILYLTYKMGEVYPSWFTTANNMLTKFGKFLFPAFFCLYVTKLKLGTNVFLFCTIQYLYISSLKT